MTHRFHCPDKDTCSIGTCVHTFSGNTLRLRPYTQLKYVCGLLPPPGQVMFCNIYSKSYENQIKWVLYIVFSFFPVFFNISREQKRQNVEGPLYSQCLVCTFWATVET